jgi:hypothetical protein
VATIRKVKKASGATVLQIPHKFEDKILSLVARTFAITKVFVKPATLDLQILG